MTTLMRLLRALLLLGGLAGTVACLWALVNPSIMADASTHMIQAPSPRWRAVFGLVFSLGMLGFGLGMLRHRELP